MEQLFDLSLFNSAVRMVAPILLAALGGLLCARVGVFNVGLEGFVLVGAFGAILGNHLFANLILAVLFAIVSVVIYSLLFAFVSIHLKANEIVVGIAMNFLALGLTAFLLRAIFNAKGAYSDSKMIGLPKWDIPLIKDIPFVGDILSGHSPLVYLTFVIVIAMHFYLFRTVSGFRLLAVGENRIAAKSIGIGVRRYQYGAILMSGALCGLAGAQLSLGQLTMFSEGMTNGRGFIALVAMMLGQSNPLGVMASSLFFGFMDAISIRLQGLSMPSQFTMMVPYVVTLIALFLLRKKGTSLDSHK
ncbi:ABC transporter permease [Paenibacillus albiflavus]|uniref:ABC transporter permease n=1 Tax=Paenibacillus albiflavus TaxID=2545760 RepID=A0A4R4EHY5_9BACL|nr:ABC transporter permease [Paenibacillus albiflavus]TCZ78810.1 ABC transporter permease [Paenibacillus albiflavus]